MSLITWTQERFATQVAQHDEEHKHLFNLLNGLHASVGSGERNSIGAALDGLIAFVAEHFAAEEKNMISVDYVDFKQHKLEHDSLVKLCVDLQAEFHAGLTQINEQTTLYLRDWLCRHIPTVDFKYAPALAAGGIK
jgi:hemerythrin